MKKRAASVGPEVKPRCGQSRAIPNLRKGHKRHKLEFAIQMRENPTPAEAALWDALKSRRLGLKFRRQAIVRGWIVDFWCPAAKLVVEVDGPVHEGRVQNDTYRERQMEKLGIKTIRFKNEEVLGDLETVCSAIFTESCKRLEQKSSVK